MYDPEQTRQLQALSKNLLQQVSKKSPGIKELAALRKVLLFHEYRYYILSDPLLTDTEYDLLYKALEKLEFVHSLVEEAKTPGEAVGSAKFATIVIDPPWDWGDEGDADQLGRARPTYSTMTIDEITALGASVLCTAMHAPGNGD